MIRVEKADRVMRRLKNNPIAFVNYFFSPRLAQYQKEFLRSLRDEGTETHLIQTTRRSVESLVGMFSNEMLVIIDDTDSPE